MNTSSKIVFGIVIVLLGVLLGVQVRGPYQMSGYGSLFNRELISKINKERIEIYDLEKQHRKINREIENIGKIASFNNEGIAQYKTQIRKLEQAMGYADVSGPGIWMSVDGYEDYNIAYLSEEKNLLILLVNELKGRGAEAISINGQRITPFSEIVLAGSHININFKAIVQPYEIKAIGDGEHLMEYMDKKSPIVDMMRRAYGLRVDLRYEENQIIKSLEKKKAMENISASETDE